jgi:hypothetical protein
LQLLFDMVARHLFGHGTGLHAILKTSLTVRNTRTTVLNQNQWNDPHKDAHKRHTVHQPFLVCAGISRLHCRCSLRVEGGVLH